MAKQRGPVASTFSGRVGNVVGAKLKGGEFVTRSYQPSVKNPRTLRQRVSRLRMATAAQLAAGLAPAILAGYGKAAGSTRMYPRNMFVRDLVKMDGMKALTVEDEVANVNYESLQLSERIGISAVPVIGTPSFENPSSVELTVTGQAVVDVLPAGKMGLVTVVYNPGKEACVVDMVDAPAEGEKTVKVKVPTSWSGDGVHVYAFYKWVPESGNDVATDAEPWKYPAETGATVYAGTGNIG